MYNNPRLVPQSFLGESCRKDLGTVQDKLYRMLYMCSQARHPSNSRSSFLACIDRRDRNHKHLRSSGQNVSNAMNVSLLADFRGLIAHTIVPSFITAHRMYFRIHCPRLAHRSWRCCAVTIRCCGAAFGRIVTSTIGRTAHILNQSPGST